MLVMDRVISEEDSGLHDGGNRLKLTRKSTIEEDEDSGTSAMLRRRKQPKITLFSTPNSKMNWTKNDELIILRGILDYQNVAELSYKADSDTFLLYIKKFMNVMFSKEQLMRKIRKLKTRFENNIEKFNNEKDLKFASSDDYEVFKLSNLLWGQNKDQFDAPLHINQPNDGASVVEHTPVAYTVMEKEKEKENGGKENGVSVMERTPVTCIVMEKEKEKENSGKDNGALIVERPLVTYTAMEKEKENGEKDNEALVEHTLVSCTDKEKEKKEKENGALVEHTFVSCTDMEKEKEKEKQQKKETRKNRKKKKEKKEKLKEKENGALVEHGLVNNTIDMEKEKEMDMGMEMEMDKENGAALESCTELEKEKQQKQQQQEKKKKEKEKQQERKEKENGALVEPGLVSYTIDMDKEKDMDMEMENEKEKGAALESYTELEKEKQQKQQQQEKKKKEKQQEQQQQEKKEKEKQQEQKQENEKNGEKEDSEEEWCDLEDALEATSFKNLSKYHQKLMLQSLRNNIGADKRKELRNEWKTLLVEEVKLNIKKEAFSAKLVNALISN